MNILCQIFLAIYSLIIMAMILTSVFTHLTFRAKSSATRPDCNDYYKIKSRSRLIDRIATSAYIIYIPFTLTYLQII